MIQLDLKNPSIWSIIFSSIFLTFLLVNEEKQCSSFIELADIKIELLDQKNNLSSPTVSLQKVFSKPKKSPSILFLFKNFQAQLLGENINSTKHLHISSLISSVVKFLQHHLKLNQKIPTPKEVLPSILG